ncbi:MAG: ABC transporter ATP-binding protein, partial [Sporichthyaceae bacterium]
GRAPRVGARVLADVRPAPLSGVGGVRGSQHVRKVLKIADRVLVMQRGRIELAGTAAQIGDQLLAVQERYLS